MSLGATIRDAVPADGAILIEMGRAFFDEAGISNRASFCTFDPESFAETLVILGAAKLLLVVEKDGQVIGMGAADVAPAFWNRSVKMGREAFFYIQPPHRNGLGKEVLKALEAATLRHGARIFDVVAESGPRSKALGRLYSGSGYQAAEETYRKVL